MNPDESREEVVERITSMTPEDMAQAIASGEITPSEIYEAQRAKKPQAHKKQVNEMFGGFGSQKITKERIVR